MADPGDPLNPDNHGPDAHDDDLVGFVSPASLRGRPREPEPEPASEAEPDRSMAPAEATAEIETPEPAVAAPNAGSIFEPSAEFSTRMRRRPVEPTPPGSMGLYAVYALILFAVPTLGVSAAIGLFAVTGRQGPDDAFSRSHFVYQQRTLWIAAGVAAAGVILTAAPFALGVPILFLLALWLVLRGASGVWALKAGRAIAAPRGWWI